MIKQPPISQLHTLSGPVRGVCMSLPNFFECESYAGCSHALETKTRTEAINFGPRVVLAANLPNIAGGKKIVSKSSSFMSVSAPFEAIQPRFIQLTILTPFSLSITTILLHSLYLFAFSLQMGNLTPLK